MEVLSEVFKAVQLNGALFYNAEFSAPWCAHSVDARTVNSHISPHSQHVIIFHLLTQGRGYANLEGDDRQLPLNAGDILIVPSGDPHILGNGRPIKAVDRSQVLNQVLSQGLKVSRMGGGGELTKFVCGYLSCDPQLSRVFLGALPALFKVNIRDDPNTPSVIQWIMWMRPGLVVRLYSRSCLKCYSSKRCDGISLIYLRNKPAGWPVSATQKSGRPWPCFIVTLHILGRLLHSRKRSAFRGPYSQNGFDVIFRKRLLPISHIGGFGLAHKCSHPRAAASRT
jgi:hypothetical protein